MSKLLSIVVPTKDRYYYLKYLIEIIKGFNSNEIELVVQDNTTDNSEIISYLETIDYEGLKYFHIKKQLSQSENSDKAILNSTGEYVCFIGDDDAVTSHIVDCVKWMKANKFDILKSELALYRWPSFIETPELAASLLFANYSNTYKVVDNKKTLCQCIDNSFGDIRYMPKVYNGIVKRSLLDEIYKLTGTFFPGPSPDMANAVALAVLNPSYVFVDYPIIIGGRSGISGGNPSQYKHGCAKIEDVPQLPKDASSKWEKRLPHIWCVETVWPESGIKALKALNANQYLIMVDYEKILAKFVVMRRWFWKEALGLSRNKTKFLVLVFTGFLKKKINGLRIVKNMSKGHTEGNLTVHHDVNDIIQAVKILSDAYKTFDPILIETE